ncbi:MAG TPA: J domain-containing protein [Burkholderiales bacterium]|jgi:DnaJ-domain-containing protein 1|nr:J domain-containing protein [Burkholderiales bacterium]
MEGFELVAIVVFFLIGYWIVDFFWPKKKAEAPAAPASVEAWHDILGVGPQASVEQIREAYLAKSAEHHPDRVFDRGPEAREAAQRMTRKLNDAFEQAMQANRR